MTLGIWAKEVNVCVCNYLCALVGGGVGRRGMFVCASVCACKSKFERDGACVFARLLEEHCSFTQCTALTFLLHLSACTKAFLPGFDKCESVAGQKR